MNKYYSKLNIDFYPLAENFNLFNQTQSQKVFDIQNNSLDKFLNLNLLDWLNYLRITIQHIECFYRRPYNKGLIHSDVNGGDFTKINYIFGGKNSYMQWYGGDYKQEIYYRPNGLPSYKLTWNSEPKLIEEYTIKEPTLNNAVVFVFPLRALDLNIFLGSSSHYFLLLQALPTTKAA